LRQNLKILISATRASESEGKDETGEVSDGRPMQPTAQVLVRISDSDQGKESRTRVTPFEEVDKLGPGGVWNNKFGTERRKMETGFHIIGFRIRAERQKKGRIASQKSSAGGRNHPKRGNRPGQPDERQSEEEQANRETGRSDNRRRSGRAGRAARGSSLSHCKKTSRCDRRGSVSLEFAKFSLTAC
jgi:hypothetical protein